MTSWLHKLIFLFFILSIPLSQVLAEGYVQLVGIPGLSQAGSQTTGGYVDALYILAIGIGAILAVLRIIFAGAKYMFTDIVPTKGQAKTEIKNVILGLLIMLSAVVILTTINPNLRNLDALGKLKPSRTELIADQRTACQINSLSSQCCEDKGGRYIRTSSGSFCENGIIPIQSTGFEDTDKANCVTGNLVWDEQIKKCRAKDSYIFKDFPVPPENEGLDFNNPNDIPFLNQVCSRYGNGWLFDTEVKKCRSQNTSPN